MEIEESIDGNFNCVIYFKHTPRIASDYIVSKYTENNDEGLIKLDQPETEQTKALTEYRYSGSNEVVKNYVNFNNETWRIIGVFPTDDGTGNIENRVKIMREESIGEYSWDTSSSSINSGYGINQWGESGSYKGADLMRLLNPGYESESVNNSLYWNRESGTCYNGWNNATTTCGFVSIGLTEESKLMIDNTKWYTSVYSPYLTASEIYAEERASTTSQFNDGVTRTSNWIGKVALPYPSDYGYASSECKDKELIGNYSNTDCTDSNWLFNHIGKWLLAPYVSRPHSVGIFDSIGQVGNYREYAGGDYYVNPVLYLSPSVKITSGTGTSSDPYELSL